jgi:hypothetical protein
VVRKFGTPKKNPKIKEEKENFAFFATMKIILKKKAKRKFKKRNKESGL